MKVGTVIPFLTNLVHEGVYFIYEDHIGRPVRMSEYEDYDSDGSLLEREDDQETAHTIWNAAYQPFGQVYDDDGSIGITVGSGDNQIDWDVPFRFPGQYEDPELNGLLFYNHHRWYSPEIGRYNRADPLGIVESNYYAYVLNNPVSFIDPEGLLSVCQEKCLASILGVKSISQYDIIDDSKIVNKLNTFMPNKFNMNFFIGAITILDKVYLDETEEKLFGTDCNTNQDKAEAVLEEYFHLAKQWKYFHILFAPIFYGSSGIAALRGKHYYNDNYFEKKAKIFADNHHQSYLNCLQGCCKKH